MTVLVAGATGNVGRHVVARLVGAGQEVRALTRRPGAAALPGRVRVFEGDLTRPGTLVPALAGVRTMLLFPVGEAVDEVVARAAEAGVRRIVVLSSAAVTAGYDTDHHYPVEQAVERSGLEWTHVRPGEFALNSLYLWGPSIRAERRVVDVFPDTPGTPVHEADIADVAAAALLDDRHAGKAYDLAGPEELTHRDRVAAIAAAIGVPLRLDEVGPGEARDFYRAQGGWAADNADFLFGFEDYSGAATGHGGTEEGGEAEEGGHGGEGGEAAPGGQGEGAGDTPEQAWVEPDIPWLTCADITGGPARTYAGWARDHVDDFR
ncbi:SDR family oxidoreductase [Streptomyces yaizuensis]|uniref:NAD(P)H-binding protein n=1 Tax=Streptomyces yaizuensis TaxID=2989713 RepID=A0ABQ5P626_9ACTN|nr:NAD(P)H-binding protein [Streptomyces sp. YSPA8]GLF97940.1 NAD(P)H-binding protein [Streptomyces sp. YSPA8]